MIPKIARRKARQARDIALISLALVLVVIFTLVSATQAEAPPIPIQEHETKEVSLVIKTNDLSSFAPKEVEVEEKLIASSIDNGETVNTGKVIAISEVTGLTKSEVKHIINEADSYDVPLHIAMGVFHVETGGTFDSTLVSHAGARGLGQIMPRTGKYIARQLGISYSTDILFDNKTNISMSLFYLNQMHSMFGTWHRALSAYNQGPGNVKKSGRTESKYSRLVMSRATKYEF